MAELVGEGGDVAKAAFRVHEQEGDLIAGQIGLEGHFRLQRVVGDVVEPVLDHELIGVQHVLSHAAHAVAEDVLQPLGVQRHGLHRGQVAVGGQLPVERHDVFLDALQILLRQLRAVVPLKVVVKGQLLVAVVAGVGGLELPVFDQLDVDRSQLGVILLIVGEHQIGVAAGGGVNFVHRGIEVHLLAVGEGDGGIGHQRPILRDQVALLLEQGHHLVVVEGLGVVGVFLRKARPEVLLLQLLSHGGHAAAEVELLHQLAQIRAFLVQPGVFIGVEFIGHILAGADEGDGVHGGIKVAVIAAGVQQRLQLGEVCPAVQRLAHRVDVPAQLLQIRALIGHQVEGDHVQQALPLGGGGHIGLGVGFGHGLFRWPGGGGRRGNGEADLVAAAAQQRRAQQQRKQRDQFLFHAEILRKKPFARV